MGYDILPDDLQDLQRELNRARTKFPQNRFLVEALAEELGEAARDPNMLKPGCREWLQVACVAMRLYTEGTPTQPAGPILTCFRIVEAKARDILNNSGIPQ